MTPPLAGGSARVLATYFFYVDCWQPLYKTNNALNIIQIFEGEKMQIDLNIDFKIFSAFVVGR